MFPPLACDRKNRRPTYFGQRTTGTPEREQEQKNTLAIALALAAGGYLVLRYADRY